MDGAVDAFAEFIDPIRQNCDTALALVPIACRQVMQDLRQLLRFKPLREFIGGECIGKQVLHAGEARIGGGLKTIEKIHFGEQHRKIGSKARHALLLLFFRCVAGCKAGSDRL